ncbi:MAG: hypothetical protein H0S80_10650 [Desulfovibrionaceae bacterium]|nr:hypothetical protein [Desulfovibrionaceae bacterium]
MEQKEVVIDDFYTKLEQNLPSYFTRAVFCEQVPGLWTPKRLANVESLGKGCKVKKRLSGKVVYEKFSFISWLRGQEV